MKGLFKRRDFHSLSVTDLCSAPYFIEQRFPTDTSLPEETRWRFCWQRVSKNSLVINAAYFRTSPTSPWIQVIYDARVIELFVPYHSGSPRFLDMSSFNFSLFQLTPKHCPASAGGTLLNNNYVCKQVHDRGLAWTNYSSVRRSEEVVVWGGIGAGTTTLTNRPSICDGFLESRAVVEQRFSLEKVNNFLCDE